MTAWTVALVLAANAVAQSPAGVEDARSERVSSYLRSGRYADARRLIDEILRTEARADLRNVLAVFGSSPNMRIRRAPATFACEVSATGVLLPLTVNGRRADWLIDTGANVSVISDAEAARLGLVIRASDGRAADLAGGSTGVRLAIAKRVTIGRTQLGDVPFLVTPADQMPWKELPPGKQGIAGLPLAIALDALRWTHTGTCYTGSASLRNGSAAPPSNLRYVNLHLVTSVEAEGKTLEFLLDTGNQAGTQLWERFGRDFESVVKERGRPGSVRVTQFGGASERAVVIIPETQLKVGGKNTTLAEGRVFSTGRRRSISRPARHGCPQPGRRGHDRLSIDDVDLALIEAVKQGSLGASRHCLS
jgi:hypothetical protein